ncbi:MAG: methyl-accepting chemotaxis protein, partial [Thaumarchaeota archaeon]|nr:methyl-accepting chemotaxis protein [Nitrososphaerota archaeon]
MAHYCAGHEPPSPGTHVFHAVAFHQGTASHGSAVTTVLSGDIGAVTDRLAELDSLLAATSGELGRLSGEIGEFGSVLEGAASRVDESTGAMRGSVTAIEGASLQLNALF